MPRTRSRRRSYTPRRSVPMLEYLEGRSLLATSPIASPTAVAWSSPGPRMTPVPEVSVFGPLADLDAANAPGAAATGADGNGAGDTEGPGRVAAPEDVAVSRKLAQALTDIKIIGGSSAGAPMIVAGSKSTAIITGDESSRGDVPARTDPAIRPVDGHDHAHPGRDVQDDVIRPGASEDRTSVRPPDAIDAT